jgi:membrane protein DedA with SNARE-associated domain
MPTDKKILNKGIAKMVWALPLFFIGPTIINSAFKNQDHPFFIPVLGLAILMCIVAVVLAFKGLRTIVSSMTDE